MFERFTEKAIKVIMLAQDESRRFGHNFVGTEQILLGLIGEGTGVAAKVLKSMGVNLKDARIEVEKIIGRGSDNVAVEIPFTSRAKRVLELSLEEVRQLGHNYIGTEHLLLGLIREGEGVAARVLENLGVDLSLSKVRTQVILLLTIQATSERENIKNTPREETMKKFTIPCDFGGQKSPFNIYVGSPKPDVHPLKYQAAWLLRERGGQIPSEVMDSFEKLHAISKENNVSFEELCVYALGTTSGTTEAKKPINTDDTTQPKDGEE